MGVKIRFVCRDSPVEGQIVIIETSVFTRQVRKRLTNEEYRHLQNALLKRPNLGTVIRGSGGLRKMPWSMQGRGKRGGVRVIYYWAVQQNQLLMLLIYPKNVQDNLTPDQLKMLRKIVKRKYP